jgi:hypothetical protein
MNKSRTFLGDNSVVDGYTRRAERDGAFNFVFRSFVRGHHYLLYVRTWLRLPISSELVYMRFSSELSSFEPAALARDRHRLDTQREDRGTTYSSLAKRLRGYIVPSCETRPLGLLSLNY